MTYRNEAALSTAVQDRIKGHYGGWARKVHADAFTGKGEPDIDACIGGRAVKVELKMPGNVPTPAQYASMRRWEAAGALAGWVTSTRELDVLLAHLDDPSWRNPQLGRENRPDPVRIVTGDAAPERARASIPAQVLWAESS